MTTLFNETIGDRLEREMRGDVCMGHVWTSSEKGATPLTDLVLEMVCKFKNDGYNGIPQIQYSSTYDSGNNTVIFSAFITVTKI
jgi:hypothetical protein